MKLKLTVVHGDRLAPRDWMERWSSETNPYECALVRGEFRHEFPFFTGAAWDRAPNAADILPCLMADAQGFEQAEGFEQWAAEYGYDPDSRKAFAIYEEVRESLPSLQDVLGDDWDELIEMEEETLEDWCKENVEEG